jgi:EpsI family protein
MMTSRALLFVIITALLSATALADHYAQSRPPAALAAPLTSIESSLGRWHATHEQKLAAPVLERLLPTEYISRVYQKDDWQIALLITYYAQHRAGETMHSPTVCLPGSGWEIRKRDTTLLRADAAGYEVNKYHIQNQSRRMLVLYWYQSRQRVIHSEYTAKLLLMKDNLLGASTDGALVRLIAPDVPGADDQALELASLVLPRLQECFRESR